MLTGDVSKLSKWTLALKKLVITNSSHGCATQFDSNLLLCTVLSWGQELIWTILHGIASPMAIYPEFIVKNIRNILILRVGLQQTCFCTSLIGKNKVAKNKIRKTNGKKTFELKMLFTFSRRVLCINN